MIYAIGHDIVENTRIAQLLDRAGERFIQRILTPQERKQFGLRKDKVKFLAKRFAAKEAFAKACGTGLREPILLSNISVLNDNLGKPYFVLSQSVQEWLQQHNISKCHLSISDEKSLSSAVVIFES